MTPDRFAEIERIAAWTTPGPWKSDGVRIGASADRMLAKIAGKSGGEPIATREANANAHLMAAAPELLAEVVRLRALVLELRREVES